jgi:hypothetical protein
VVREKANMIKIFNLYPSDLKYTNMKKTLLSLLLLLFIFSAIGQNNNEILLPPKVDKRAELLSIVFRLAGNDEYNMDMYKSYVQDIHTHFDKYKNHPAIKFAKNLRKKNGVSFDAVMAMAIHLEQPPSLKPLIPFTDSIPEPRWGAKNSYKFVQLLQQFYVDAKCEEFFKAHEAAYFKAEERFKVVFDSLDLSWYKKYYGKVPDGKFSIIIGLGNGGCNYGAKLIYPDKKEDIYAVMGTWSTDSLGVPIYSAKDYLPILIHEFNHSFVNQLINLYQTQLENPGKIIFKQVEDQMQSQAYADWKCLMNESLVRASVIMYMKKHEMDVESEMIYQLSRSFIWIKELVELLDQYEKDRTTYPTLASFMPQIVSFYQGIASNIITMKENYAKTYLPHVASIQQFENNATDVDPNITEIKVFFDKPLVNNYSFYYGDKGKKHYPLIDVTGFSDNFKAITIKVALKPNWEYQMVLKNYYFKTKEGFHLEDYLISFKTRK